MKVAFSLNLKAKKIRKQLKPKMSRKQLKPKTRKTKN